MGWGGGMSGEKTTSFVKRQECIVVKPGYRDSFLRWFFFVCWCCFYYFFDGVKGEQVAFLGFCFLWKG